jgi:hypothetical protein
MTEQTAMTYRETLRREKFRKKHGMLTERLLELAYQNGGEMNAIELGCSHGYNAATRVAATLRAAIDFYYGLAETRDPSGNLVRIPAIEEIYKLLLRIKLDWIENLVIIKLRQEEPDYTKPLGFGQGKSPVPEELTIDKLDLD